MGRRRPSRHNKKKKPKPPPPNKYGELPGSFTPITKENALFRKFYTGLGLMPFAEVQDFYEQMKEPLPVTFRISGYKGQGNALLKIIRTQFLEGLRRISRPDIKPPRCLTWYPGEMAWQVDMSRRAMNKLEILTGLHEIILSEMEVGNMSKQEATNILPPMILDIQPHHKVLDLCGAPGFMSAMLVETIHKYENTIPEGFLVVNEKDKKKCDLMIYQAKRLASPCCMVVNNDPATFPNLQCSVDNMNPEFVKFDRVLVDAPCGGDGTLRKNIDIWTNWHPTMGNSYHREQVNAVKRGLELLEIGGRLVYSTCSMLPVENEAVIAEILRQFGETVQLVNISSYMRTFKTVPGISNWRLMDIVGNWVENFEAVPDRFKQFYTLSMFPPTVAEARMFNLHMCHRVLPHHQDTGGYFVAALQKISNPPWPLDRGLTAQAQPPVATGSAADSFFSPDYGAGACASNIDSRKRRAELIEGSIEGPDSKKQDMKEEPFLFLESEDPLWLPMREFFGLADHIQAHQFLYRSERGTKRSLFFVSQNVHRLVVCNEDKVRFVNMGVRLVSGKVSPLSPECDFRIAQDCMGLLLHLFTNRKIPITRDDAIRILKEENPFVTQLSDSMRKAMEDVSDGSAVFIYRPTPSEPDPACEIAFNGWRGKVTVRCFVPRHESAHFLRLFGQDLAKIKKEVAELRIEREKNYFKFLGPRPEVKKAPASEPDESSASGEEERMEQTEEEGTKQ